MAHTRFVCFRGSRFFVALMEISGNQRAKKADESKFVVGTNVSSQIVAIIFNAFEEPKCQGTYEMEIFVQKKIYTSRLESPSSFDCRKNALVFVSKQFIMRRKKQTGKKKQKN